MVNVNIRDRQCAVPECSKYPSCNFPGSTDGLYCGALIGCCLKRMTSVATEVHTAQCMCASIL